MNNPFGPLWTAGYNAAVKDLGAERAKFDLTIERLAKENARLESDRKRLLGVAEKKNDALLSLIGACNHLGECADKAVESVSADPETEDMDPPIRVGELPFPESVIETMGAGFMVGYAAARTDMSEGKDAMNESLAQWEADLRVREIGPDEGEG